MTIKAGYEQFVPPRAARDVFRPRDSWLILGPNIWLSSRSLNSVGDFFAGAVVLHDPDHLLHR